MTFADASFATVYVVIEWVIRLVMLALVPFRRTPESARAWLLLVLFLPIPGVLLYALIGRPAYPRRRRRRLAGAAALLETATKEIAHSRHCRQPRLPDDFRQAAMLIEKLGRFPALGNNGTELIADYEGVIARLVADIDAAQDHVHLLMYIFSDDPTGELVMEALVRASARGVTCRVLIDAFGSRRWARRIARRLSKAKIVVARALPVHPWRRGSARADLRNHRKIAVIDGIIGFVGSQNIVDRDAVKGFANEEMVVRIDGPTVVEMQAVFAVDWYLETEEILSGEGVFRHHHGPGSVTTQLMPSGPDYGGTSLGQLTVALIHAARERVVITTPYFVPEEAMLLALRTAVLRGVAVHIILPLRSDHLLVRLAQQSYYSGLLDAGVQINRYRSGFLHAKHISVDDEVVLVGSSNVDVRSFVLNAEVTLIIYDRQVAAQLRELQERHMASSDLLTVADWERRPLIGKLSENIARLVSPLL